MEKSIPHLVSFIVWLLLQAHVQCQCHESFQPHHSQLLPFRPSMCISKPWNWRPSITVCFFYNCIHNYRGLEKFKQMDKSWQCVVKSRRSSLISRKFLRHRFIHEIWIFPCAITELPFQTSLVFY
jgi:hypothetical protein